MPTLKDGGTNVKVQKIFILKNNMKNIHLQPTSQLSRLVKIYNEADKKSFELKLDIEVNDNFKEYQNIYITSEEKPKAGDWSLYQYKIHKCIEDIVGDEFKKIILTTDQDLDGVQPIDDKFLEWFVKNPSCEFVDVGYGWIRLTETDNEGYWISIPDKQFEMQQEEPKQEPLEEVAEKVLANNIDGLRDALQDDDLFLFYKGVIQCYGEAMANYQAKRMYSEEDMRKAFIAGGNSCIEEDDVYGSAYDAYMEDWFKQFKNK
jgi:hypothetical protein